MSIAMAAIFIWVACAGLTTIPASRAASRHYAARHIAIGPLLFWPAVLTWLAMERVRKAVGL